MGKNTGFSAEELQRAREVTAKVREPSRPTTADLLLEPTENSGTRWFRWVLGILLLTAVAGFGWWQFWPEWTASSLVPEATKPSPVRTYPSANLTPTPSPATRPSSGAPTVRIEPVVVQPKPRPVPPRPAPPSVVNGPTPSPVLRSTSAAPAISSSDRHAQAAAEYAKTYFRSHYKLGSSDLRVLEVVVEPVGTSEVPGWGQYRSEGDVVIRYYSTTDRFSGTRETRRGYEAISVERNGQIAIEDFDVKTQPFRGTR